MRQRRIKQIKVISTNQPEDFETKVNSAMRELSTFSPVLQILDRDNFTAVIEYEKTEEIIETVADEFHAAGVSYRCIDCPHIDRPMDGRVRWAYCKFATYGRTHIDSEACEFFYKEIAQGKAKPYTEGE